MPAYMNGKKLAGGYMNGHRVNGFINGAKLFDYRTTVKVMFTYGPDEYLYNVPTGKNIDLYKYGFTVPKGFEHYGGLVRDIKENDTVFVEDAPGNYTATIFFKDTHHNNISVGNPLNVTVRGGQSYSAEDLVGNAIPSGYNEDYSVGNVNGKPNGNYQLCQGDMTFAYYVYPTSSYTPSTSSSSTPVTPSYNPGGASGGGSQTITRPISWVYDGSFSPVENPGGSTSMSAPEGTVGLIQDLANVPGVTKLTLPEGCTWVDHNNPLHFYAFDQGQTLIIRVKPSNY